MNNYKKLHHKDGSFSTYQQVHAKQNNEQGILFLSGFKSDMNGTKAQALSKYAKENNLDLTLFEYSGHGNSSGEFIDGTIGLWLENTLNVIDLLTDKPQILVGSSMGGWIMLLAALARPERVSSLIGLAAAPDFTEELIWDYLNLEQKDDLLKNKKIDFSNEFCDTPYPISLNLITEARNHLLLDKEIPLDIPIHLIHGMNDKDVPYQTTIRIAEKLTSNDVNVHLIKEAGHGLSRPQDLEFIYEIIKKALRK
ncbi:MAG: alpha/beta hydrolase [Rickettsiales bacterium]|jgi:pimeloyl-ACP methyl ester carboxylesterase|nr:alpha/beta hydrolase [Rickettsiales bacterium]